MKALSQIIMLGLCLTGSVLSGAARALVPLEGLVLGEVSLDTQQDPLSRVFAQSAETGDAYDRSRHRTYAEFYRQGLALQQSCQVVGEARYATPQDEIIARRSIIGTLQYIGLDVAVKAIGTYANLLQLGQDEYKALVNNLVGSSCSPNMSVYGHRLIRANLLAYFKQPNNNSIPSLLREPYSPALLYQKADARLTKERELHHAVNNFRALCSWDGDTSNYRLLAPYLSNPLVMALVHRHLLGETIFYDDATRSVGLKPSKDTARVVCKDFVCRRSSDEVFLQRFPRTLGSSGLAQDLQRQWCGHFRYQNYLSNDQSIPQVRQWLKERNESEDRKDLGFLVSLFTGLTDMEMTNHFNQLASDLKAPMEMRWGAWAKDSLKRFSKDLLYEEIPSYSVVPYTRQRQVQSGEAFRVDLALTMGELDKVFLMNDKLDLTIDLEISRNWLRWFKAQSAALSQEADQEALAALDARAGEYLAPLLNAQLRAFPYYTPGSGVETEIAADLIRQLDRYRGTYFSGLKDQMVKVPVHFHYGLFALSYIRYKGQLNDRFKRIDEEIKANNSVKTTSVEP